MRLITFGCSLTYGQNMPDNVNAPRNVFDNPSNQSWPSFLAKLMNVPVVNYGYPGASCKEIWGKILSVDIQPDDIVVILWTHPDRWCTFKADEDPTASPIYRAHPSVLIHRDIFSAEKIAYNESYYGHIHDDYDVRMDFILRANHIYDYINRKGAKQYHYRQKRKLETFEDSITHWNFVPFSDILFNHVRKQYPDDLALDNTHPGAKVYSTFASLIYEEIKDELQ